MKHRQQITGRALSLTFAAVFLLAAGLPARAINLVQEFYLPMPEQQIYQSLSTIQTGIGTEQDSIYSIVVTGNGTEIVYDQWEDGYEVDLSNPTQASTQIWGDGNDADGIPPGFAHNPLGLPAGTVITLTNNVPLPRNPSVLLWDGGDRIGATKAIVVTHAGWPVNPGPVFAGAVSVLSTIDYGTNYISPVGQNLTNHLFSYVGLFVMAAQNNTAVLIDPNGNGIGTTNIVLNQGQSYLVNGGVKTGGRITASEPVQADLVIGHINGSYAADWFTLYPTQAWGNAYYTPVPSASTVAQPAYVYLYNPNPAAITVNYDTLSGAGSFSVPATNVYQFQMPVKSGASFVGVTGAPFYALCTVAANNSSDTPWNWGFTLLPKGGLTTAADVGWAPGSADAASADDGNPVWVSTLGNTTLYVAYHGGTNGLLIDTNGNHYDTNFTVSTLQSLKIYDPSHDQTGMKIYTLDGTLLTAAWGEDADVAASGNPYIDAGTTVLPFPVPLLRKTAVIITNVSSTNLVGDTVLYTVEVDNRSLLPLGNTVIIDAPSGNLTYVPQSTTFNSNAIPDNATGQPFPLAAPGYTIPIILSQGTSTFQYLAKVNAGGAVSNTVDIASTSISVSADLLPPPTNGASCNLNFTDTNGVTQAGYTAGASVFVTLVSAAAVTSSNSIQTLSATVNDMTSGDVENVPLTETGINTGVFRNLAGLPSSTTAGLDQQDGILHVAAGDVLSVTYVDPNFGDTCSANATILVPSPTKQLYLSVNGSTNGVQDLNRVNPSATTGFGTTYTSVNLGVSSGTVAEISTVTGTNGAGGTTMTLTNVTVASGSSQMLLVGVSFNPGSTITGITYAGKALTLVNATGDGTYERAEIWQLLSPPVGITNVVITFGSAATDITVGAMVFNGVNQTTPFSGSSTNGGDSTTATVTIASAAGDDVVNVIASRDPSSATPTGVGQVKYWSLLSTGGGETSMGAGSLTPGASSVTNSWSLPAGTYWSSVAVSINPAASSGGTNMTIFTQTPAFCENFTMPSNQTVTVTNYVAVTSGSMPASPNITATLQYNGTNFLTLSNPVYSSASNNLVWSGNLASNVTVTAGQVISYVISNNQSGVTFKINYDSTNAPSKISLPATTVIAVNTFGVYDAPYPGGNLVTTPDSGATLYIRADVSDPFGSYDITSLGLAVTGPSPGSSFNVNLGSANVVASDTCSKTYEYAWATGPTTGGYSIAATAAEGTEGVTAVATASLTLIELDLGVPTTTLFTSGNDGAATNSYAANSSVCISVTDLNQNLTNTVIETVNATITSSAGGSEAITLTETGTNTGVFTACISSSTNSSALGTNNGVLYAPVGSVLTASYPSLNNPSGASSATATIQPSTSVAGVVISKTILSPSGGQVGVGQPVTYNLQVFNTGSTTLPNLSVTDAFSSASLSYVSASLTPNTVAVGLLTWTNLGALTPGQSTNFTVTFNTVTAGTVTNSATANAVTATNTSSVTLLVNKAALNVIKTLLSPTNTPVSIGSNVVFRITLQNVGNSTITTLPLEDDFSAAYYQFVSATIPPNGSGAGELLWTNLASPVALLTNATITNDITMLVVGQGSPAFNTATVDYAFDIFGNPVPDSTSVIGVATAAAGISGHVYNDINQSGVFTNGDTGLSGVTIQLFTDPTGTGTPGTLVQITTTDGNGFYELLNLNLGHYVVVESFLPGYTGSAPANGRLDFNLATLTTSTNNNFFQYQPGAGSYSDISGTVYTDANGFATNTSQPGLVNVEVDLVQDVNSNGVADPGEPILSSTTTGTNGYYSFAGVTPGHYVIREVNPFGYYSSGNSQGRTDNQISFVSTSGVVSTTNNFFERLLPTAVDETNSALYLVPTTLYPLTNCISPYGDALTITAATTTNGPAVINTGSTNLTFDATTNETATITYTIADQHGGTSTAIITVNITALADLAIGKTASATVLATSNLTYTISVTNLGPSGASGVVVTDALPASVTFVSASGDGTNTSGVVSWNLGVLTDGQVSNLTVTVSPPASGGVTNVATVSSPISDPNPTNGVTPPVITTVTPQADIAVTKTGPVSVLADGRMTYTISMTNNGPSTATNVVVRDNLPAAVTSVIASSGGILAGNVVTWPAIASLTNGATTNYTVMVTAPASGSFTNTASATSGTPNPNPGDDNGTSPGSQVTTTVTPVADVAIGKSGPAGIVYGANYNYTISVTNFGPSTAMGISVTDSLPAGLVFVSSVPATTTNAGNQVIWTNLADLPAGTTTNLTLTVVSTAAGTVTNMATGGSLTQDPNPTNNMAPPVVTVVSQAAPLVTWPVPVSIVYGTPLGTNQNDATSTTPGTAVYNPTNGTVLTAGTNTLTVVYTPTDTNYAATNLSVSLVVLPAPLTVTANSTNRTYGQANPALGGTITGLENGDNITATYATTATASSPAGGYPIIPTLVDPSGLLVNYSVTTNNGTLTVNQALLGITANSTNRIYETTNPVFTYTVVGFVNGDTAAVLSGSPSLTTTAVTNSPIGSYTIVATNGTLSAANYSFSFTNGVLMVDLGAPLVTWPVPVSIVYGTPLGTNQNDATSTTPGTAVYNPTNGTVLPAGTNTLTVVYTPTDTNYAATNLSVSLVVLPAPLTVTANSTNRTYGQANPALGGTITGLENGDNITATYATTATASSPAGGYPIIPTLVDPSGLLVNYSVTTNNGTLTVNQAVLGITANSTNRIYETTNPVFTFTAVGFVNGDTAAVLSGSPSLTTTAVTNSPIGSYTIVATNGTLSAANYSFSFTNGVLMVDLGAPLVTWPVPVSIVYGTPLGTNQNDATSTTPGTAVYNPTNGTVLPAGTNTLTVVYTPTDTNYAATNLSVSLVVLPAPLTVTANSTNRTYGQANPALGGTITGLENGDNITATYATTATASSPAGGYPIIPTLVDPSGLLVNYSVTTNNGTLTVNQAVLGITANSTNRIYETTNPVFTYTVVGFVNGDTAAVLSGSPSLTTTAVTNSPVGSYTIVATNGTLSAANYSFSFTNGVLMVDLGAPLVTWPVPVSIVYGTPLGTNQNDATSTTPGTAVYNPTNGTVLPAGTNTLTVVYTPTDTNYAATNLSVSLVVLPAPLTVTANSTNRTYGQVNPALGGTITGLENGDNITATYATTATASSPAGGYPIIPTLVDPSGLLVNYSVTTNNGTLTVNQAVLGITANSTNRIYETTNPVFTYTVVGFVNGDTAAVLSGSPSLTTTAVTNSPIGSYTIVATNGTLSAANYSFSFTNGVLMVDLGAPLVTWPVPVSIVYGTPLGTNQNDATSTTPGTAVYNPTNGTVLPAGTNTLTVVYTPTDTNYAATNLSVSLVVLPAPLTVTATNVSQTYGQVNPVLGGTITGLENGDNITATYATTATASSPAGGYPIIPTLVDPSGLLVNYNVTTNNGTLTVNQALLGITANSTNRIYGTTNPVFTFTAVGFVNGDTAAVLSGSPSLTTTAVTNSPVGSYTIVATNGTLSAANYSFSFTNGVLMVDLGAPLVTWPVPVSIVYGTPLGTNQNDATSTTPGTAVYNPTNGTVLPAGTNTLTVVYTPTDTNYAATNLSVSLVVLPAPLTVTANSTNRTYGQVNPALGGTITGLENGDNITATYATTATASSPAGGYPIIPTLVDPSGLLVNYSVTTNNGTLTVNQAVLGITANSTNRIYETTNPVFTYTVVGFVNGDTAAVLSGSPSLTTTAVTNSPIGSYTIVATNGTLSAANYSFSFTNGVLMVDLGAPLVTWPVPVSIVYGTPLGTNQNDATSTTPGTAVYNPTNGTVLTAGTNTLTVVYTPTDTNYAATNLSVSLVVLPAPLTVTATNVSRTYGQVNPALGGTITGLENGDNITATYATTATASSPAGGYPIIPTLVALNGSLANYSVTTNNGTLTVNQAVLGITANSTNRIYGTTNPVFTYTVVGFVNGDTAAVLSGSPSLTTTAVTNSPIGSYTIVATNGTLSAANYSFSFTNGVLMVDLGAPLVTWPVPVSIVYGTPLGTNQNDATSTTPGTAVYNPTNGTVLTAGTNTLTVVYTPTDTNYAATNLSVSLVVLPAPLTVTANSTNRTYGQANPALGGTITGLENGDNITATYATTATASSPAGGYPIIPTLVALNGSLANYSVTTNNGTLTVNQAVLGITANSTNRIYETTNPVFTYTVVGFVNGDTAAVLSGSPSLTTTAVTNSPVGSYTIVATNGTLSAANYSFSFTNGVLMVDLGAPLVTWPVPVSIVYGTPLGTNQNDATSTTPGTAVYNPTNGTVLPAGTNTLTVVYTPTDTNYAATNLSVSLVVLPAPLTVTANSTNRTYGQVNPVLGGTITGIQNGDNITATYATTATASSPAGGYPIIPALAALNGSLANYSVTINIGILTVNPAVLSVTANNTLRGYGAPNPPFTGTIAGIQNGDNITATYATTATATSPVGPYPITPTLVDPNGKLSNYTVIINNGTLTVTTVALSVTANNASRGYGAANPTFTGTITGIQNGDNITATYATTATATSPVGPYPITPTLVDPNGKLSNYTVTVNNGSLTVTTVALSVTANSASRGYGAANPTFTGTITGIQNGDNITATYATTATATSPVGPYPITPTLVDPNGKLSNYTVTVNNGSLTVTTVALSVTANNTSRGYGAANPTFTGTITGIQNGDNITATYATTATATSPVGPYPITLALADPNGKLSNYTVTINNGTLMVTTVALSVTANSASRGYGAANPTFTGTITGIQNGDNITATYATTATATSPVGPYAISPTLVDPNGKLSNYTVTINNATLTVTTVALSVTANSASRGYGAANPTFTGTITGIQNGDNITATYATTATATSPVGPYAITPTLVDPNGKLSNYTVTINNATLTVTTVALSVTANNASRGYGAANPTFTGAITGVQNGDNITATYATTATATSPVGPYAITPTLVDPNGKLSNYTVTSNNGTLTVSAVALSVTANNASRVVGAANPAFTGTITGIQNGDDITATYATTATTGSPVGLYPIIPTLVDPNGSLVNYSVTTNNGTLTVTNALPADIAVFKTGPTNVPLGATFSYTITVTNLGPGISANVVAVDDLPTNLVYVSDSGNGSLSGNTLTWQVGSLTNGATTNFTITVAAAASVSQIFTNIASATSTTTDPNPVNNNGFGPGSQVASIQSSGQFGTSILDGTNVLNPQTGLFEEQVTVTNSSPFTIAAVRLFVNNLPTGVDGVELYNATGTNAGVPYVQYNGSLAANQTVVFLLEFYNPSFHPFTATNFTVEAVLPTPAVNVTGGVPVTDYFVDARPPLGPRFVIEFPTTFGQTYTVLYSDDNMVTWTAAAPSIIAGSSTTQWYDDGPPKTVSKPLTGGTRFYRVIVTP